MEERGDLENKFFVNVLYSPFEKMIGLMFSKKKDLLFIFDSEKYIPIHSFFVFYPFKAVYLNKSKKIVDIKHVNPFQLYVVNNKPARYLIELTSQFDLKIGDCLSWEDVGLGDNRPRRIQITITKAK